jgi:hypothetical protein
MTIDIQWNGTDVVMGDDGQPNTVEGQDLLEQSIAILVDDELDDIGNRVLTSESVGEIDDAINRAIDRDVDIGDVESLSVTEINRATDTVTVEGQLSQATDSTITVTI